MKNRSFRLAVSSGLLAVACTTPSGSSPPGAYVDLDDARFDFADFPWEPHRLELENFEVDVSTAGPFATSHVVLAMHNPSPFQREARLRLPLPPGAAVTGAVLHVGSVPMPAAFVERGRAAQIYRQITERRRDPLLVSWAGPEMLALSLFPLEPNQTRRIELDWVEPIATRGGDRWYRVPVVGDYGRLVGTPHRMRVDGRRVDGSGGAWLSLGKAPANPTWEAEGYRVFTPIESRANSNRRVVLMLETSSAMDERSRGKQVETARAILAALPAQTHVSILAVDWLVRVVVEDVAVDQARRALEGWTELPLAGALHPQRVLTASSRFAAYADARLLVFLGQGASAFADERTTISDSALAADGQALVAIVDTPEIAARWSRNAVHVRADRDPATIAREVAGYSLRPGELAPPSVVAERARSLVTVTGETVLIAKATRREAHDHCVDAGRAFGALWRRSSVEENAPEEGDVQVVSPSTSLLALENASQYAHWGIAPASAAPALPALPMEPGPAHAQEGALGVFGYFGSYAEILSTPRVVRMPREVRDMSRAREAYAYARSRLLREHRPALASCLAQGGLAAGGTSVEVLLTVTSPGDVVATQLVGVSDASAVARCLRSALRSWSFPAIGRGDTYVRLALSALTAAEAAAPADEDELTGVVRLADGDPTLPIKAAKIYDLPYWANVEHLGWLVANSNQRRVPGFTGRAWAASWLTSILAAKLLRVAGSHQDAQRILSEVAPTCPPVAACTFSSWGLRDEAAVKPRTIPVNRSAKCCRHHFSREQACAELAGRMNQCEWQSPR
jgi:hypothetical protein